MDNHHSDNGDPRPPSPKKSSEQRDRVLQRQLQWLLKMPSHQRREWLVDRLFDPRGPQKLRLSYVKLFLRGIQDRAGANFYADTDRVHGLLAEIWLELDYLIPLIEDPTQAGETKPHPH